MSAPPETLVKVLDQFHQSHLLQFWDQLDTLQQHALSSQLLAIDWPQIDLLARSEDKNVDWASLSEQAQAPPAILLDDPRPKFTKDQATASGEQALREGKVGFILVAGGQGTRLGFDRPKGLFPVGPVSRRTLFEMHCDMARGMSRKYGVSIPVYVMTSPATDAETRSYFQQQNRCGLDEDQLQIFCQGMMPAVDATTGKVLLSSKASVALSPDGHGGLVAALQVSSVLDRAEKLGIDYFYYAQIDNPMAKVCQPDLVGYHLLSSSQMTTQVVKKRFAEEKVGNVVQVGGRVQIIEYSDLPPAVAQRRNADGSLQLWAGNIAIHVFDRSFLKAVVQSDDGLPFHRAFKKVPFIDQRGQLIEPAQPNAIKFERFVFDLLPLAKQAIVVEGSAAEVFAPIKNANGAAVDTPAHSQQAILNEHRRWIELAGSSIDPEVPVEISPLWAVDASEVAMRLVAPVRFSAPTFLT